MTPGLSKHVYTTENYAGNTPCDDSVFVQEFSDSLYVAATGNIDGLHYMFLGIDPCEEELTASECDIDYVFSPSWNHVGAMSDRVTLHRTSASTN